MTMELATIETLQRLLFLRRISLRHRTRLPLAVLLSCWDELSETERASRPETLLATRAPLLFSFLSSNWDPKCLRVWGLSSTGKALPRDGADVEFARAGAENMGYLVEDANKQAKDLTIPLSWLLETTNVG